MGAGAIVSGIVVVPVRVSKSEVQHNIQSKVNDWYMKATGVSYGTGCVFRSDASGYFFLAGHPMIRDR